MDDVDKVNKLLETGIYNNFFEIFNEYILKNNLKMKELIESLDNSEKTTLAILSFKNNFIDIINNINFDDVNIDTLIDEIISNGNIEVLKLMLNHVDDIYFYLHNREIANILKKHNDIEMTEIVLNHYLTRDIEHDFNILEINKLKKEQKKKLILLQNFDKIPSDLQHEIITYIMKNPKYVKKSKKNINKRTKRSKNKKNKKSKKF